MFNHTDFDRRFKRAGRFHAIFSTVVLCVMALIFAGTIYGGFVLLTQPEKIGGYVGRIEKGYEDAAR